MFAIDFVVIVLAARMPTGGRPGGEPSAPAGVTETGVTTTTAGSR